MTTLPIKKSPCKIRCFIRAWFGFFVVIFGFVTITDALGFFVLVMTLGACLHIQISSPSSKFTGVCLLWLQLYRWT